MVESIAQSLLGKDNVLPLESPSLGSEDFAYYLQHKPGAVFYLGIIGCALDGYSIGFTVINLGHILEYDVFHFHKNSRSAACLIA